MATVTRQGDPMHTVGELPAVGTALPPLELAGTDLGTIRSADLAGRRLVLNIFPSVDTGVCAMSVRRFNELAADLEDVTVLCISQDLPFAQARFCGAEGIDGVVMGSAFRSSAGDDLGVTLVDGPMAGLLARAVVVCDEKGEVTHSQLVEEISEEPDYEAALAALR